MCAIVEGDFVAFAKFIKRGGAGCVIGELLPWIVMAVEVLQSVGFFDYIFSFFSLGLVTLIID